MEALFMAYSRRLEETSCEYLRYLYSQIEWDERLIGIKGARGVGKTTMLLQHIKLSFPDTSKAFYVSLDHIWFTTHTLLELTEYLYTHGVTHLFLDEVQNIDKWPLLVNRLLRQKVHLILTGSNANLLSDDLSTHITGRYNEIHLYPFSFRDYCVAHRVDIEGQSIRAEGLRGHALNNYLMSGGLPETFRLKSQTRYVRSLIDAILNKDICRRYKVRYKQTLQQIANGLLDHFCQEVNYDTVQHDYQLRSIHTAKNYVSYIEKAYLIRLVPRYSFKSIERQAFRKVYAVDTAFVTTHADVLQTDNWGWRLENAVAIELMRRMEYADMELFYLRENRSYEVDFAVVDRGHVTKLVQVTYDFTSPRTKLYNREIGGLLKAAAATHCHDLTLIMMSGEPGDLIVDDEVVHRVLATDWFLNRQ